MPAPDAGSPIDSCSKSEAIVSGALAVGKIEEFPASGQKSTKGTAQMTGCPLQRTPLRGRFHPLSFDATKRPLVQSFYESLERRFLFRKRTFERRTCRHLPHRKSSPFVKHAWAPPMLTCTRRASKEKNDVAVWR